MTTVRKSGISKALLKLPTTMRKLDISDVILKIIVALFVTGFTIMCFYPFYFIVINSISSARAVGQGVYLWPRELDLSTYRSLFERPDIGQAFLISGLRTGIGTLVTLISCSILGFAFSKRHMFLRTLLYRILVATMYISAGLIPWYITMRTYNLQNTFALYILPFAVNAFYVVLLKTYFEQLPDSLEESAEIDGAGIFIIIFRIILPMAKPILATVAVFSAVMQWGAWQDAFFLVTDRNLLPMQLVLYNYLMEAERLASVMRQGGRAIGVVPSISPETIRLTAIVVTVSPVLLVYPALQRYFAKGIMIGAIKG